MMLDLIAKFAIYAFYKLHVAKGIKGYHLLHSTLLYTYTYISICVSMCQYRCAFIIHTFKIVPSYWSKESCNLPLNF